ncbi:MAG: leucine--tRNA ligase [Anaerolineae bacterium]|nr:leucine--tRNA ligase [Anaerolineae bacterium]
MTDQYVPQEIEPKWQRRWADDGLYRSRIDHSKPKHYALTMLPYPSGNLHIGHWYAMAPSDVRARYMRMQGYNVLFPIGFDAFGLPAENAAIQHAIHPHKWTLSNVENMQLQFKTMGMMFDWEREAVSCLPGYYRWTEWLFLKLYDMGLAYRKKAPVDFCPKCNTTLAREQVWGEDRHCERCGTPVIKKELEQWFWRITDYADELLDFSKIDWPERVVAMQTNWIGRSEGADVTFLSEQEDPIVVFTTRPDTLWGATFMVLAPEHPLVDKLTTPEQLEKMGEYKLQAARQSEIERMSTEKEKTGIFIGAYAVNPVNNKHIPIWIADYVMMTYGTGAIMAVPAHDERDFAFALKFGLPIIPVIDRSDGVAKSFAFPGSVRDGFAAELQVADIEFEVRPQGDKGKALYVTLHGKAQIDQYIKLMRAYIKPNEWNEVVGARWTFIFDDEVREFDSVEADREILARCKEIYPPVSDNRTLMEMLYTQPFYRDMLFHAEYGTMVNSGPFSGTPGDVAVQKVTEWLEKQGSGEFAVNYRIRDWLISRQRYWGAPIPMVYCDECGVVPVPYEDLPVLLPEDAEFLPTGESPLKYHAGFLHTTCPRCGGPATRETDTMDTFACSSWYNYAYLSPYYKEGEPAHADSTPIDPEEAEYWLPVDVYTGGIEHATMHLIYTRFFTKAMRDMGLLDFDEPMTALRNQGIILGEDSEKMSKSRGNVIAPDDLVERYGADTVRGYLMFGWRWEQGGPWDSHGIEGVTRWLPRVWNLVLEPPPSSPPMGGAPPSSPPMGGKEGGIADLRRWTHKTIRRVTDDMEAFAFNTIIAGLMEFTNTLIKAKQTPVYGTEAWEEAIETLLLLLAPCCPHIAEELWARTNHPYSVHLQSWPQFNADLAAEKVITLVVQVNGKVRARLKVPAGITEETARETALSDENIQRHTGGKEIRKIIYVPGRLVNIVV